MTSNRIKVYVGELIKTVKAAGLQIMLQSQWQYIPRQHMVKKTFYVGSQSDTQLCTMQNWHIPIVKHIFIF